VRAFGIRFSTLVLVVMAFAARAEPRLAPGDEVLRQDIQLLADSGVLNLLVTTWPLSWPQVANDISQVRAEDLDGAILDAFLRVKLRADSAAHTGSELDVRARGAHLPWQIRGFDDTPREEGELRVAAAWMSNHFAANFSASVVKDPSDGQEIRPDGSYLAANIANVAVLAGYVDNWWGPGWEGSLILSNNARPMPSVLISRNLTDPFKTRLLSWIGPWNATLSLSQAEGSDVAVADVRLLAARVNFKPRPWFEIGLSRTAQWCGEGRPCGWSALRDLAIGHDNEVGGDGVADQPGNQMAGYDVRLRSPWRRVPFAFYSQWIGEDEAGGLPAKFIGQFGLETWASTSFGALRAHVEYSDTACNFSRHAPNFDCAYRNAIFPQGYTFRGRNLGHSMDNDSRMYSLAMTLVRTSGDSFGLIVRRVNINRDGGQHTISEVPRKLDNVSLRYSRAFGFGKVTIGLGLDDGDEIPRSGSTQGYVTWQQGF
jgi:capsule assembly protein Wzi